MLPLLCKGVLLLALYLEGSLEVDILSGGGLRLSLLESHLAASELVEGNLSGGLKTHLKERRATTSLTASIITRRTGFV